MIKRERPGNALKRSEKAALRLAQETGVMAEIGRIISSSLDIEEVYERFAEEVHKLIPFDRIVINLVNPKEGTAAITYVSGMEIAGRSKRGVFPLAGKPMEEMLRTRAPVLFYPESIEDVETPGLVLAFESGLRSRLLIPLFARGEVIGGLSLWSKQARAYGERDIRLAQGVSSQIAGAIANAQLFRDCKQAEEALRYKVGFEDLVTSISTSFINLASQEIGAGINSALERLGKFADVDRSYVFTFSDDGREMSNTHEWCAPGIEPFIRRLQKIPVDSLPWFYQRMMDFEVFHITDVSKLPPEADAEKSDFKDQGIQSVIAVPMVSQRSLTGFVGFDSVRKKKAWPEDIIRLLKIVGEIIANALGRKKAEEILMQSEAKYRNIFENAVEGIFQSTPAGRYLSVNPAFARMYGYESPQEVLPAITDAGHQLYVNPEDRTRFRKVIEERGYIEDYETECYRRDGSRIPISMNARVVRDAHGKVLYYEGTVEDITKRKQAEEELQKERQTFFTILENDPSGVALIGKDGVYQYLNPEFTNVTGYSLQDVPTGKEWLEKAYPDPRYRQEVIDTWKTDRLSHGRARDRGFAVTCKDGKQKEIEFRATSLRDYSVVVLNDVTERKRAEEKIQASLQEKEVLLKEIHHRVKNNLQIVSSLLYLQANRTEHPGAVAALRESRSRVKSMALIHERLYQSPNLASVDMGEYTRNLVSDLQLSHRAEDSSVRLTVNVRDIPLGITEAIPCGLIINELVSNSLKHAFPEGRKGEVVIQLTRVDTGSFALQVRDNGIGLPEHVDFRKSPSLGLTLVNSLVEQLGGTIELDRREGTAFTITFG
jgi:PAS domain S-box-containing protein